jgi:hypothetical protein
LVCLFFRHGRPYRGILKICKNSWGCGLQKGVGGLAAPSPCWGGSGWPPRCRAVAV